MATELKPGEKVHIKRAVDKTIDTPTKSGPTLTTFVVAAAITGLVAASLYFSTVGRNAPALIDPPRGSAGQSSKPHGSPQSRPSSPVPRLLDGACPALPLRSSASTGSSRNEEAGVNYWLKGKRHAILCHCTVAPR